MVPEWELPLYFFKEEAGPMGALGSLSWNWWCFLLWKALSLKL